MLAVAKGLLTAAKGLLPAAKGYWVAGSRQVGLLAAAGRLLAAAKGASGCRQGLLGYWQSPKGC